MSTLFLWKSFFSTNMGKVSVLIKMHIYKVLVRLVRAFLMMV